MGVPRAAASASAAAASALWGLEGERVGGGREGAGHAGAGSTDFLRGLGSDVASPRSPPTPHPRLSHVLAVHLRLTGLSLVLWDDPRGSPFPLSAGGSQSRSGRASSGGTGPTQSNTTGSTSTSTSTSPTSTTGGTIPSRGSDSNPVAASAVENAHRAPLTGAASSGAVPLVGAVFRTPSHSSSAAFVNSGDMEPQRAEEESASAPPIESSLRALALAHREAARVLEALLHWKGRTPLLVLSATDLGMRLLRYPWHAGTALPGTPWARSGLGPLAPGGTTGLGTQVRCTLHSLELLSPSTDSDPAHPGPPIVALAGQRGGPRGQAGPGKLPGSFQGKDSTLSEASPGLSLVLRTVSVEGGVVTWDASLLPAEPREAAGVPLANPGGPVLTWVDDAALELAPVAVCVDDVTLATAQRCLALLRHAAASMGGKGNNGNSNKTSEGSDRGFYAVEGESREEEPGEVSVGVVSAALGQLYSAVGPTGGSGMGAVVVLPHTGAAAPSEKGGPGGQELPQLLASRVFVRRLSLAPLALSATVRISRPLSVSCRDSPLEVAAFTAHHHSLLAAAPVQSALLQALLSHYATELLLNAPQVRPTANLPLPLLANSAPMSF